VRGRGSGRCREDVNIFEGRDTNAGWRRGLAARSIRRKTCPAGSGGRGSLDPLPHGGLSGDRLQAESIVACGNHVEWNGGAIPAGVHVLGFEPCAQTGVVDFGLALPEVGSQSTLDPEMIQLQFDGRDVLGEVAANVVAADVDPRETLTFALRFDYHKTPALHREIEFHSQERHGGRFCDK
jgi:hypothetical protein